MDAKDIDAHPIHSTLSQLRAARDWPELLDIAPESSNAWMLQKVFQFLELVRFRLDATPRTLISVTGLTSLNNALAAVLTELTNYKANPSPSYLENAVNHVDQTAMNSLWAIPGQATQEGKAELGQIANAFYEQVQAILSKIETEKAELQERFDETVRQVREQTEQIKESDRQIAQQKADAAAISAELKRDFTVIDQEFRTKFGTMSDEQKAAHVAQLNDEKTAADLLLAELAKKRDEAADIVQIVGNIGVTGNYQKIALQQASQADNWRLVTFGVFAVAAAFGAYTLMEFGKATIDWTAALVRMAYSFVIATVALYTGKESARHRTIADSARRRELELASLGPFIESIPKEKREAIREKLTDRYFGGEEAPHTVESVISPDEARKMLEKSIDGLTDVAKQAVKR